MTRLPWPGEIWVLTFSRGIPGVKPLEVQITDVDSSLVWFVYTDKNDTSNLLATPTEIFPSLYTYVRGPQCKTQAKKSFSFKTAWQWLRSFFTNVPNS